MFFTERSRIVELVVKHRLPTMFWRQGVRRGIGGLMAYGASIARSVSTQRDLRGQDSQRRQSRRSAHRAADDVQLVINLKAAKALGLTIPPAVLAGGTR